MSLIQETYQRLQGLPGLTTISNAPLSKYTRFGIGGPADLYGETRDAGAFVDALKIARSSGMETVVIGGGTNLIVSDDGFRGLVLKFASDEITSEGTMVHADGGATLQTLVDYAIDGGLRGIETMTGIPGSVGAAVYGNAGAYGHSISERVVSVRFIDDGGTGGRTLREFDNARCEFRYRESIFKRHKEWIIVSCTLALEAADARELRAAADRILSVRNAKYPPTMKCAGSIFKNFLLAELPPRVAAEVPAKVVIEGKVPSAWFLEQVGAKGMQSGDIHVADYHANLIYNAGNGAAADLVLLIQELKRRVTEKWGIPLEEEVQYVGFAEEAVTA
jgi:UDP-N-acetylmuramate dehydrogenase